MGWQGETYILSDSLADGLHPVDEGRERVVHCGLGAAFLGCSRSDHLVATGLQCGAEDTANRSFIVDD